MESNSEKDTDSKNYLSEILDKRDYGEKVDGDDDAYPKDDSNGRDVAMPGVTSTRGRTLDITTTLKEKKKR